MGIFTKFKKMFSSDIAPDVEKLEGLVFPYALKGGKIKINSFVTVPSGYSFLLGYRGRVLDCFGEGKFPLSPATLPECSKRLKIHKQDKNGNNKKSFKSNAYFVNLADYSLEIRTLEKAELGKKASGIFSVGLTCDIKVKVSDAKKIMESLLNEYDYIKLGEADKLLKIWISDMIVGILNRYNFALSEFLYSNSIIEDNLKVELGRRLSKIGIILIDMQNVRYILPKKHQKIYEQNLQKQQEEEKKEQTVEVEPKEEEQQQTSNLEEVDKYTPYGNIFIEETSTQDYELTVEQVKEEIPQENKIEFVDLNLDNLYNSSKDGKRCNYCGYINKPQTEFCEVCESKLKGE